MNTEEEPEVVGTISDINMTPVIVAAIIGLIFIALFIILRKRSSARRDFLLTGLSESGKSAIFMRLLHKKFPDTYVSVKENMGEYKSGGLVGRIIDIPGHYRVRDKCFDQYKRTAKGIIFVVDSVTIQKDIRDVADALYTILSDIATLPCSFLVLCSKQDVATAKSVKVLKQSLEKEMNLVRGTRGKLEILGENETNKPSYLGKNGKDFEFSHLQQNIQFYECSAKEGQLNHLTDWLDKMLLPGGVWYCRT
uniref:Signal recognition particle receptor subunit beta n=1 Tax=Glossina austeni TaxID=7395 RepID=A0A1A9V2Y5_GLOAU